MKVKISLMHYLKINKINFIFILSFLFLRMFSQSNDKNMLINAACTNIDFETGNASGWSFKEALKSNPITGSWVNSSKYKVVGSGQDAVITTLSKVPQDGGAYALMLGDSSKADGQVVRAYQNFSVTPSNSILILRYAFVLETEQNNTFGVIHPCNAQPYFETNIVDNFGNRIPCSDYVTIAPSPSCNISQDPNFKRWGTSKYFYRDWETKKIDLSSYVGKTITIEILVADCNKSSHSVSTPPPHEL